MILEKNIKRITIYRAYDVLFLGYYEHALRVWTAENNVPLRIVSPKHGNITYSPRDVGIRGQMYFEIETNNKIIKKCFVDISDGFDDIRLELLKEVDVYFKCNNSKDYVSKLEIDSELKKKIASSSLFFPVNFFNSKLELTRYKIKSFFELVGFDKNSTFFEDIKRWRTHVSRANGLNNRPNWAFYDENKNKKSFDNDIFYSVATWHNVDNDLMHERAKTIEELKKIDNYKVHAEFIYNKTAKEIFPELMINYKRNLLEYFDIMNNSKIVVINKSLSGGAISWRVGECLALGKVYIHEFSPNDFYETLLLDDEFGVFYDREDLIKKLNHILSDDELYKKMQKQVQLKYQNYFQPIKTASYLLNKSLE